MLSLLHTKLSSCRRPRKLDCISLKERRVSPLQVVSNTAVQNPHGKGRSRRGAQGLPVHTQVCMHLPYLGWLRLRVDHGMETLWEGCLSLSWKEEINNFLNNKKLQTCHLNTLLSSVTQHSFCHDSRIKRKASGSSRVVCTQA